MTAPQRAMLARIAESRYGEHHIRPAGRRTAQALVDRGFLRWTLGGWAAITDEGRAAIREKQRGD